MQFVAAWGEEELEIIRLIQLSFSFRNGAGNRLCQDWFLKTRGTCRSHYSVFSTHSGTPRLEKTGLEFAGIEQKS